MVKLRASVSHRKHLTLEHTVDYSEENMLENISNVRYSCSSLCIILTRREKGLCTFSFVGYIG